MMPFLMQAIAVHPASAADLTLGLGLENFGQES